MTFIGVVLIPLAIFIAFRRPDKLLSLLVFCSVLEAGSVLNVGTFGLSPYYFVAGLIFFRYITRSAKRLKLRVTARAKPLMWFYLWAACSAILLPIVFSGLPVIDPRAPLEQVLRGLTPLHFSPTNLIQLGLLSINVVVFLDAEHSMRDLWPVFKAATIFEIALVGIQAILGDHFPYSILNNNPAYAQAHISSELGLTRPSGSFAEPSVAGAFFAGAAALMLVGYLNGRVKLWLCLACIGAMILVGSGSGLAAFAMILVLIMIKLRPWHSLKVDVPRLRRWGVLLGCAFLAAVLISPLIAHLAANTVDKQDSFSLLVRAGVDLLGWNVFLETKGLGVGLGSFRASSFTATMLASVGLPGVLLFLWFLKRVRPSWLVGGTLLAMALGVPDISMPILWSVLILQGSTVRATRSLVLKQVSKSQATRSPLLAPHAPPMGLIQYKRLNTWIF